MYVICGKDHSLLYTADARELPEARRSRLGHLIGLFVVCLFAGFVGQAPSESAPRRIGGTKGK